MDSYLDAPALLARGVASNGSSTSFANGTPLVKEAFVSSITLAMVAITAVSFCLARRLVGVSCYSGLPLARWCMGPSSFRSSAPLLAAG